MIDRSCTENGFSIKQVVFRNGTKQPQTYSVLINTAGEYLSGV
jgi:hypothetical protein